MINNQENRRGGFARGMWVVGGILCIVGLVWGFQLSNNSPGASPAEADAGSITSDLASGIIELSPEAQQSANLKVAQAELRRIESALPATGVVAPDRTRLAHIRPLTRGLVEEVLVQQGDRVKAGAALMRFDNIELGELIHDFMNLRAEISRAEIQAEVTRSSLGRAEVLLGEEAIARKEYEIRDAQYKQALSLIRSKQAELAHVEEKIHRYGLTEEQLQSLRSSSQEAHPAASRNVLRAPFGGVITMLDASPGELLEPEHVAFTLADTSVVWVLADIYEKDLGNVRMGQTARVRVPAYPEEVFTGRVAYLSEILDPESRTGKLRCEVANPEGKLKLEMFATVEVPLPPGPETVAVPQTAVQRLEEEMIVFTSSGDSRFEKRVVELGRKTGEWVEIRAGLRPGEPVVTEGAFYLKSELLREQISGE